MMPFIVRGNKKIFLTHDEIFKIYSWKNEKHLSEDIESILDEHCRKRGLFLKKKLRRKLVERATSIYEDSNSNDEDWIFNCEFHIKEAFDMLDDNEIDKKKFKFLGM